MNEPKQVISLFSTDFIHRLYPMEIKVLNQADTAIYQAKHNGKDRFEFFEK